MPDFHKNAAVGLPEAQSGTSGLDGSTVASNAVIGLPEAQPGTCDLVGGDAIGEALGAMPAPNAAIGLPKARLASLGQESDDRIASAAIGLPEARPALDLQTAPLAVVIATRELLGRQYSEHLGGCATCREISRAYHRAVLTAVGRQEAQNTPVPEAPALHCCTAIGIDKALRGVEAELERRAAAEYPTNSVTTDEGE